MLWHSNDTINHNIVYSLICLFPMRVNWKALEWCKFINLKIYPVIFTGKIQCALEICQVHCAITTGEKSGTSNRNQRVRIASAGNERTNSSRHRLYSRTAQLLGKGIRQMSAWGIFCKFLPVCWKLFAGSNFVQQLLQLFLSPLLLYLHSMLLLSCVAYVKSSLINTQSRMQLISIYQCGSIFHRHLFPSHPAQKWDDLRGCCTLSCGNCDQILGLIRNLFVSICLEGCLHHLFFDNHSIVLFAACQ